MKDRRSTVGRPDIAGLGVGPPAMRARVIATSILEPWFVSPIVPKNSCFKVTTDHDAV